MCLTNQDRLSPLAHRLGVERYRCRMLIDVFAIPPISPTGESWFVSRFSSFRLETCYDREPTAEEKISNRIECHHGACMLRYRLGSDQNLRVLAI